MKIDQAQIESNKARYISLLKKVQRGADIDALIKKLDDNGFFEDPASTRFHNAFPGGLCAHSLNVYDRLISLINETYKDIPFPVIYEESALIVALCHDLDKMSKYELTSINKKVYKPNGSKQDEVGNFDWESSLAYKVRDEKDLYIFGTHGQNSERITSSFIPLSDEESSAIINHHSVYDNPKLEVTYIYNKYSLACLLHVADMLATYVDEKI